MGGWLLTFFPNHMIKLELCWTRVSKHVHATSMKVSRAPPEEHRFNNNQKQFHQQTCWFAVKRNKGWFHHNNRLFYQENGPSTSANIILAAQMFWPTHIWMETTVIALNSFTRLRNPSFTWCISLVAGSILSHLSLWATTFVFSTRTAWCFWKIWITFPFTWELIYQLLRCATHQLSNQLVGGLEPEFYFSIYSLATSHSYRKSPFSMVNAL